MKTLAFILALAAAWPVVAQTTYKISELTELAAAPADTDWLIIWDTSAATSKKISRANFLAGGIIPESFGLTDPGADRLLFWDDSAGVYRHLTLGTGLSISDTTINAESGSGTVTLTSARIAYGAADNTLTSEAGFEYDATFNILKTPGSVYLGTTGSGVSIYPQGSSGILTIFNDFTDETLLINLGNGGADTAFLTSDSGVNLVDFGTIEAKVPTEAYDATNWNGDNTVPTKDAVRDKIEAITVGSAALTATRVGYGDGSNNLTGEAAFTYNATTNTLAVDNMTVTTLTTTNLSATSFLLKETSGVGTNTMQWLVGSDHSANQSITWFLPDADLELTVPATMTLAGVNYANSWTDGVKQTFNPNGTNAGVNVGAHTADPSTLANADVWYQSTDNKLMARINGASVDIGTNPVELLVACSDETTALTTGTSKVTFRMPYAMTLTSVRASVGTAPVGSTIIVDINEAGSTIMTTNKLSIDASEKTSTTAATAAGLTDTALADDAEITIDIDQIGSSTAGAGLKVLLKGTR